jgi:glycine dehydrogenase subunit 1
MLSRVDGVRTPVFKSPHFKEFTVNFDEAGLKVETVNRKLLEKNIQGGRDLSKEFPELGQTALFCVTEVHSKEEIQHLTKALEGVLGGR